MKKKWMALLFGALILFLAACSGGDESAEKVSEEQAIVNKNCITCHGDNLEGRNGPALDKIGSELSEDEILTVIQEGKPGMPGNLIEGEEAEKVAAWLAEKK